MRHARMRLLFIAALGVSACARQGGYESYGYDGYGASAYQQPQQPIMYGPAAYGGPPQAYAPYGYGYPTTPQAVP